MISEQFEGKASQENIQNDIGKEEETQAQQGQNDHQANNSNQREMVQQNNQIAQGQKQGLAYCVESINSDNTASLSHQQQYMVINNEAFKLQMKNDKFIFQSAGYMIPHPKHNSKQPKLSSDYFQFTSNFCGVTDGVSQWKQFSINPRIFAQQLLENTTESFYNLYDQLQNQSLINETKLIQNLGRLAIQTAFNKATVPGSCTIITYYLIHDQLNIDVIGDSLLIVIRPKKNKKYELIYAAKPKQYEFNKPYQLIKVPNKEEQAKILNKIKQDKVEEFQSLIAQFQIAEFAQVSESNHSIVRVKVNDLIICGSDGFFDNLYCQDIIQIIQDHRDCSLEELSYILCLNAWEASQNEEYESPFAEQNIKQVRYWEGGKEDDVTVLVSKIASPI